MMKTLVIPFYFTSYYLAAYNRFWGFAKEFQALGVNVRFVVFYSRDMPHEMNVEDVELIKVKVNTSNSKIISTLRNDKMMWNTLDMIVKADDVILTCQLHLRLINKLIKKGCKVFVEITEHPDVGSGIKRKLQKPFVNGVLKKTSGLFVITNSLYDYYMSKGFDTNKITIINMFVDNERFSKSENEVNKKLITYCGTISVSKDGVDCLLDAFKLVHQRHREYKLMLIGRFLSVTDESIIKDRIEQYGLSDFVILLGRVDPERMVKLLKSSSILALARPNNKQAQFGFPTKLGEYLATGNPVVVTRVGELSDFLSDKVNCVFAKPDNSDSFADSLIWVIEHPELSKQIGLKGKGLTIDSFSCKTQTRKAFDFIENVCNKE